MGSDFRTPIEFSIPNILVRLSFDHHRLFTIKEPMNRLLCVLVICLPLAACSSAPTFKVAVIVDTTTDPVSRAQAEAILAISDEKLIELTGVGLQMVDFVENDSGAIMQELVTDYMDRHPDDLPNGILIFSTGDEDRAKIHRAYAQQVPGPEGFRNPFVSPIPHLGDSHVYIAVVQFNHLFAACGYGGMDSIQSPVSIGNECRGEEGTACAAWEGMQVCQVALPFLEGRTRVDMVAEPVIHEFLHPFGLLGGPDNHYGTEACNLAMGWAPDHYEEEEAISNAMMCPSVVENFANSYHP